MWTPRTPAHRRRADDWQRTDGGVWLPRAGDVPLRGAGMVRRGMGFGFEPAGYCCEPATQVPVMCEWCDNLPDVDLIVDLRDGGWSHGPSMPQGVFPCTYLDEVQGEYTLYRQNESWYWGDWLSGYYMGEEACYYSYMGISGWMRFRLSASWRCNTYISPCDSDPDANTTWTCRASWGSGGIPPTYHCHVIYSHQLELDGTIPSCFDAHASDGTITLSKCYEYVNSNYVTGTMPDTVTLRKAA